MPAKRRILPYSAKNSRVKPPAPYSMLNPETNSDSPSAKSKGVRLASAKQVISQIPIKGSNNKISPLINRGQSSCSSLSLWRINKENKIKAKLTS